MNANQNSHIELDIQCPDCGTRLELSLMRKYFYAECDRAFSEDEIRKQYGI